ncbi:MAG: ParB/RepB/Spo0J family partition protein [Pseudomonadota bacterium]
MMKNKALGRGLSSLLKEEVVPIEVTESTNQVDIDLIYANSDQPRKYFDDEKIQELADSISTHGLLQPIIVKKETSGKYKIVAGERRYRASKIAQLKEIPVIIKDFDEKEVFEVALIENIQRDELTAIEEAQGYQKLVSEYGYTQSEIASVIGKSRSHIANLLRLNQLPESIKNMINDGSLSMGHARCLVGLDNAEEIAKKIIANDLSVRKTEELVSTDKNTREPKKSKRLKRSEPKYQEQDEDLIMLSDSLSEKFGVKVIVENSNNGGRISIYYSNLEELDSILTKFD